MHDDATTAAALAALPKVDLHVHSESTARLERFDARRTGRRPFDWDGWSRRLGSMPPGTTRLDRMEGGLDTDRYDALDADDDNLLARIAEALDEAARDGGVLVEVRFAAATVARPGFMALFRRAEAAVRARRPTLTAEALACTWPTRPGADEHWRACLAARADGLAGVDFIPIPYDDPTDWSVATRWARQAADAGLGVTAHAGEFSTTNLAEALALPGLTRLGHGIHAIDDPELMAAIVDRRVALEVCLTTNHVYGAVRTLADHPLRRLLDAGAAVTLATDCPVRTCTSIGREYALAHGLGLDLDVLATVTQHALEASFTTPERRSAALQALAPGA